MQHRAARRGEHHPVGAADEVLEGHVADASGDLRHAAVAGIVAVVAEEEVVALGHGVLPRVVHAPRADVEDVVDMPAGKGLDLAGLDARPAEADGIVGAARRNPERALPLHGLDELARVFEFDRRAVEVEHAVDHLDPIARQADQALDELGLVDRMDEDDDVAALGLGTEQPCVVAIEERAGVVGADVEAEPLDPDRRAGGVRVAVGEFVDEQEVADEQGVLHRAGRNPEGLEEQGAEHARDQQRPEQGLDDFPDFLRHFGFRVAVAGLRPGGASMSRRAPRVKGMWPPPAQRPARESHMLAGLGVSRLWAFISSSHLSFL